MKRAPNDHRLGVEKLRWQLIFALSGVGAVMASCSGRSSRTVDDDGMGGASNAGKMGTTGGKGGNGAGGTPSATGGKGGSGGTNGGAGGTTAKGGSAGFALEGGTFGTPGGAGNVIGGTAGFGGDIAGGGGVSGVSGGGGDSGDGFGGSCTTGVGGQPGLCDGGFVHRPTAATCMLSERLDGTGQAGAPGAAGTGSVGIEGCDTDFDCTEASNGYCTREPSQGTQFDIRCTYACATDADCAAGSVCTCDNSFISNVTATQLAIGRCVSAACTTDADCEPGMLCIAPVDSYCGPRRATTFHCQSPNDECAGPDDCMTSMECAYAVDHYECRSKPACGRPFLVDGASRQSELGTGREWHDDDLARAVPVAMSLEARTAIAAHFAESGLMEHASIAAFARFSLQLLALGAPPELVSACTAAMVDETRHARLCFGLASRYAGRSIAPGPLDVTGALAAVTLRDVVELVVHEGCIGETAAALEATWAAEAATDPLVREVLQGIAEDEGRHAALAFQFVAWAVGREPALAELVARRIEEARLPETASASIEPQSGPELEAHGVLSSAKRQAARQAALRDVLPGVVAVAVGSVTETSALRLAHLPRLCSLDGPKNHLGG
jgi:hypothetical protein